MSETVYRIKKEILEELAVKTYEAYGLDSDDAKILCSALIRSDMRGVKSHGLVRTPDYVKWINDGTWAKKTEPEILVDAPAVTVIDGHNGLGPVLASRACDIAVEKARKYGIAFTTVKNSNHFGEAGLWSTRIAENGNDMIGFTATSTIAVCAAPDSRAAVVGSNPFSFAAPSGSYTPVCLDVACGAMAAGKIFAYRRAGEPLPEKAFIGPDGNYITDPFKYDITEYIMAPFAGHKGFGLAVIMEAMTSFVSGGHFQGYNYQPGEKQEKSSQSFMAVNIGAFTDPEIYKKKMDQYIEYMHAQPARTENGKILYPGEIEGNKEADAAENGVCVAKEIFENIAKLAEAKGIDVNAYRQYNEFEE